MEGEDLGFMTAGSLELGQTGRERARLRPSVGPRFRQSSSLQADLDGACSRHILHVTKKRAAEGPPRPGIPSSSRYGWRDPRRAKAWHHMRRPTGRRRAAAARAESFASRNLSTRTAPFHPALSRHGRKPRARPQLCHNGCSAHSLPSAQAGCCAWRLWPPA